MVEIALFDRGWVTLNENFRGKGTSPPTNFGIRKLESLGYRMVKKIIRKLWKSTFSEGVRHFERQFQIDRDVARNRSMDRWIGE